MVMSPHATHSSVWLVVHTHEMSKHPAETHSKNTITDVTDSPSPLYCCKSRTNMYYPTKTPAKA